MNYPEKIFSAQQIKEADKRTIEEETISSVDLMERAAMQCVAWLQKYYSKENKFVILCGPGNNGGDGLAITRLLLTAGYVAEALIIREFGKYSPDFLINKKRLYDINAAACRDISSIDGFPVAQNNTIIIDAIFGTGLSRAVSGLSAACITSINNSNAKIISIDIPSGLFADTHAGNNSAIVKATHTLSFQFPKLAFFFPQNAEYVGDWQILDIGLSKKYMEEEPAANYFLTNSFVKTIPRPRKKFSHKGTYGHALLIAGSYGKMGAAVLATRACLRSGVGLLTVHVPACGYEIMQVSNPEAMVSTDTNQQLISDTIPVDKFSSIAIGPGTGTDNKTQSSLHDLLTRAKQPLVLDADALNIISANNDWLEIIPPNSILTPHPKEFERLAGKNENDFERHNAQIAFSKKYKLYIILKGAHTCITTPSGESYFNTTGNPGMAKGGSGDILTGIIAGILAQGYDSLETCLLGVFIHGCAGDHAKNSLGEMGMIAGDITDHLPAAFKQLSSHH